MNTDEKPEDEFGLTTEDYEQAGLFLPKRTRQAQLAWTREDGKHASVIIYDHEIQPLLDALEEGRRQERRPQNQRTIRNRLTNLCDKYF
jgi:hypothetical protein